MKKLTTSFISILTALVFLFQVHAALAHVVVKPSEVGAAAFQTFTAGVPNEKESPVVAVRLVIPEGLNHVSPNVKPGWKIDVKKTGEGEEAKVTEITWTNGSIPAGQRDDFLFSAQVPAKESALQWKAYQTYENGEVVAWDQEPTDGHGDGSTPYSETKVVDDLKAAAADDHSKPVVKLSSNGNLPIVLSFAAIALSAFALIQSRKKK